MMKYCTACGEQKSPDQFPKHRRMPGGLYSACKACKAIEAARYRSANTQKCVEASLHWYKTNQARARKGASLWKQRNPERIQSSWSKWYAKNREALLERRRGSPALVEAVRRRHAAKLRAVPSWANRFFMHEAYDLAARRTKSTGIKWVVDHAIPLINRHVCGLHTHSNLRVIPAIENARKGNKLLKEFTS